MEFVYKDEITWPSLTIKTLFNAGTASLQPADNHWSGFGLEKIRGKISPGLQIHSRFVHASELIPGANHRNLDFYGIL